MTRLDRLARSTPDLLNVLATIAEKDAGFRSLADPWADTTTAHGRLMLTVLGGLAEFERELIRARTDEGRKRAMARGVRFGRKPKLTPIKCGKLLRAGTLASPWWKSPVLCRFPFDHIEALAAARFGARRVRTMIGHTIF